MGYLQEYVKKLPPPSDWVYVNNFLYGITYQGKSYEGYLKKSGSSTFTFTQYPGGGLFPDEGSNYENVNNVGFLYIFRNSNKSINSSVYLTLESIYNSTGTEYAYGVALILI